MFRHERQERILELLDAYGDVEVSDLASRFDVSQDSIRKDLKALSDKGLCRRFYGGASRVARPQAEPEPYSLSVDGGAAVLPMPGFGMAPRASRRRERTASGRVPDESADAPADAEAASIEDLPWSDTSEPVAGPAVNDGNDIGRMAVAQRAYEEIADGDSIFLDISRTNSYLATLIASGPKHVIVTTNMLDVMQKLANKPNITVLGTGGYLNVQLNGFVGSATVSLIEPLLFSKAFIGVYGVSVRENSVMAHTAESAAIKRALLKNSSYRYLLADASKFSLEGPNRFGSIDDFSAVITDSPDHEVLDALGKLGVPTIRAEMVG